MTTKARSLPELGEDAAQTGSARAYLLDFLALTKPRIIILLLVTAVGAMFLAAHGAPPAHTAALVLMGGSLGAGGANALNHYLDRDIDQRMARTRWRPLPSGRIEPRAALAFGIGLNLLAFGVLAVGVTRRSAALTLGASVFYVVVYTHWLKRTTTQNIVIGGAAGAIPPLVGWAAITGGLHLEALYLFGIVFFWTPPHFWALALLIRSDYAAAGVPMLPVVRGAKRTAGSILLHAVLLVTLSLLFFTVEGLGWLYLTGALVLGAIFLQRAWRLRRDPSLKNARSLYLYSLLYLAALFAVIVVDSVL